MLPLIRSNREVASSATLTRCVPRLFLTIRPSKVQIATHDMSLVDRVMIPREGICPNAAVHESAVVRTTRFPRHIEFAKAVGGARASELVWNRGGQVLCIDVAGVPTPFDASSAHQAGGIAIKAV